MGKFPTKGPLDLNTNQVCLQWEQQLANFLDGTTQPRRSRNDSWSLPGRHGTENGYFGLTKVGLIHDEMGALTHGMTGHWDGEREMNMHTTTHQGIVN